MREYPRRKFGLLMAVVTAFVWGTLALFIKFALRDFGPLTISWFRLASASLVVLLGLAIFKRKSLSQLLPASRLGLLCGIFLGLNYIGYSKGVELSGAANTQILIQSASLFFVLAGVFIFKEKLTKFQTVGVLMTFLGISLFSIYKGGVPQIDNLFRTGSLFVLFGGLTWGFYAVFYKIASEKFDPNVCNMLLFFAGSMVILPFVGWSDFQDFSLPGFLVLIYLSAATLVAYSCAGLAIKHAPVAEVTMILTCNPIITLTSLYALEAFNIGWISPEPLSIENYVGAALTISGTIIVVTSGKESGNAS